MTKNNQHKEKVRLHSQEQWQHKLGGEDLITATSGSSEKGEY